MVYLDKNTENIYIPIMYKSATPAYFRVFNQTDHTEYSIEVGDYTDSGRYYILSSDILGITAVGQYTIELYGTDGIVLYTGILQVGDYKRSDSVYTRDINITQYNK